MNDEWGRLVSYAITGQTLDVGQTASVEQFLDRLAEHGWDLEAIRDVRGSVPRWPIPVRHRPSHIGAAQFSAVVARVSAAIEQADAHVRDATMALSPRDRQLLADRPPHHGAVG